MMLSTDRVFVDTGAFIAMAAPNDDNHDRAQAVFTDLLQSGAVLFTTNHIVDEVCTWMLRDRGLGHRGAIRFGRQVLDTSAPCTVADLPARDGGRSLVLIYSTPRVERLAWDVLAQYDTAGFTFTDCTSFAVMRILSISRAFTFDSHFDIMGFQRL